MRETKPVGPLDVGDKEKERREPTTCTTGL